MLFLYSELIEVFWGASESLDDYAGIFIILYYIKNILFDGGLRIVRIL